MEEPNGNLLRYQVAENTKRVERLEAWRGNVDEDRTTGRENFRQLRLDMDSLRDEMRGVRRVMVGVLATIATASVGFALTVLIATGKL